MNILEITILILCGIFALWGLFHQLIVGGAVSIFHNLDEKEARLFLMSWVAHGAMMSYAGILNFFLLLFFSSEEPVVRFVMGISGLALMILCIHVLVSGLKTRVNPVIIGAILQGITGTTLFIASVLAAL